VPEYPVPQSVIDNRHKRGMARRPQPCGLCGQYGTALYTCGHRCPDCAVRTGLQLPNAREAT
jgi:hypothetical protein